MVTSVWRLAITGGIGSGKSTVAKRLTELGAVLIDADAISREVTAPGGAALPAIAATFGSHVLTAGGELDRDMMRTLVFTDEQARLVLERIIHPLVVEQAARLDAIAQAEQRACVVYDIPLLGPSSSWRRRVDHIVVIDCDVDTQIERVMARNHLTRLAVESIVAAQTPRSHRLGCADSVLFNSGRSITDLIGEVDQFAAHFGL